MEGWRLQNIIFLLWWMKTSFNIIYGWFSNLSIWTILSKEEVIFWFWMRMEKIQNFLFNLKTCHAVAVSYDLGPYQTSWDISSTPIFQSLLQTQFWKMENEFSCDQNPSWWLIQHFSFNFGNTDWIQNVFRIFSWRNPSLFVTLKNILQKV